MQILSLDFGIISSWDDYLLGIYDSYFKNKHIYDAISPESEKNTKKF